MEKVVNNLIGFLMFIDTKVRGNTINKADQQRALKALDDLAITIKAMKCEE